MLEKIKILLKMKNPESALAHKYLDGLSGIEIGGSAHNPFGLDTKNVDFTDSMDTIFKREEDRICGEAMKVDIVAPGDKLPVADGSQDFVVSSHVLEHFPDPIKALKEWYRIIRNGGYIFMIVPHKERTGDKERERTTLQELVSRHENGMESDTNVHEHFSVWVTRDVVELINHLGWKIVEVWDVDDKAGNGFMILVQKTEEPIINNDVKISRSSILGRLANRGVIALKKISISLEEAVAHFLK